MSLETIFLILEYLYVFALGCLSGWVLESVYRSVVHKKWFVNPGFLSGPFLPLYGFGLLYLFALSSFSMGLPLRILLFFGGTTLLELVTGLFFTKFYKIQLWDYSREPLNFKGLICLKFSLYWTGLSLVFYFLLYPLLMDKVREFFSHPLALLFLGFFGGLLVQDVVTSLHLASRMRKAVIRLAQRELENLNQTLRELTPELKTLNLDHFKNQFRSWRRGNRGTGWLGSLLSYFNPFSESRHSDVVEQIEEYFNRFREKRREENHRQE